MYAFVPKLRVTPFAGPQVVYDLSGLPQLRICWPDYEQVTDEHAMVDRTTRPIHYGWRRVVSLAFLTTPGSAFDSTLQQLEQFLAENDWSLEVTLDGTVAGYRACYARGWLRQRVQDKNVGVVTSFTCVQTALINQANSTGQPAGYPTSPPVQSGW